MTDGPKGRNRAAPERVEAWEWVPPVPVPDLTQSAAAEAKPEALLATFDLNVHWLRGGFRASLYAPTDEVSQAYLDDLIATDLVIVPEVTRRGEPIDAGKLLRTFARHNGHYLDTLQRRLGYDSQSFNDLVDHFCAAELIFRLPCLPDEGRPDIYYFCDTGVLHRLFNPKWQQTGKGRKYFARSWEGFVVRTICRRYGLEAEVFVWREADLDEIDLVLRWPNGECWAIEIGIGENKKPSKGYKVGVRKLAATEFNIIHRGAIDWVDGYERMTLEAFLTIRP